MLSGQGSRQFSAFICVYQPDGFKDFLTGDFCCRRGQILGIEVGFDFLGQLQPGFVETLLVYPDAGADAQYPEILRVVAQTETLAKRERAGRCQPS